MDEQPVPFPAKLEHLDPAKGYEGWARAAIERIRKADEEAERAAIAFSLGAFGGYWQAIGRQAVERMQARYAELGGDYGNAGSADGASTAAGGA